MSIFGQTAWAQPTRFSNKTRGVIGIGLLSSLAMLSGCQSNPVSVTGMAGSPIGASSTQTISNPFPNTQQTDTRSSTDNYPVSNQDTPSDVYQTNNKTNVIVTAPTPIPRPVERESTYVILPPTPRIDPQQDILQRARTNSQATISAQQNKINNGDTIPAFRRLMDTGITQLKRGEITAAQDTFTRAQRLAPQSSAVYFYLGQVALKQNQPIKAEAMARRGLVVAQTLPRKQALWQVVLKSAQMQGDKETMQEAQTALSRL